MGLISVVPIPSASLTQINAAKPPLQTRHFGVQYRRATAAHGFEAPRNAALNGGRLAHQLAMGTGRFGDLGEVHVRAELGAELAAGLGLAGRVDAQRRLL